MVTGDYHHTAISVARDVGMVDKATQMIVIDADTAPLRPQASAFSAQLLGQILVPSPSNLGIASSLAPETSSSLAAPTSNLAAGTSSNLGVPTSNLAAEIFSRLATPTNKLAATSSHLAETTSNLAGTSHTLAVTSSNLAVTPSKLAGSFTAGQRGAPGQRQSILKGTSLFPSLQSAKSQPLAHTSTQTRVTYAALEDEKATPLGHAESALSQLCEAFLLHGASSMSSVFSADEGDGLSMLPGHLPSQMSRLTSAMSQMSSASSMLGQMSHVPSMLSQMSLRNPACVSDDDSPIPLGCTPSAFEHRRLQRSASVMQSPPVKASCIAAPQLDIDANNSSLPLQPVLSVPGQQHPPHSASSCKPILPNTPSAAGAMLAAPCSGFRITTEVGRSELHLMICCLCCNPAMVTSCHLHSHWMQY